VQKITSLGSKAKPSAAAADASTLYGYGTKPPANAKVRAS
jgi:hypothetical protein